MPGESEEKMTIDERINRAIENFDGETDNLDKIIAVAYFIGIEEATTCLSDKVNAIFAEQKKKAKACRYHNMAMRVQGDIDYIFSPYCSQSMKTLFASDETEI